MIRIIAFILLSIGIGLTVYSIKLPYFTNLALKEKLEMDANTQILTNSQNHKSFTNNYYTQIEKIRTAKTTYFDLGTGIITASLCVIFFLFSFRITSANDFKKLKFLKKNQIFIFYPAIWLLMIPGSFWYYSLRGERGDYPIFADSIAIPIFENIITIIIGLIGLVVFLIFTTLKSKFPVFIFIKANNYTNTIVAKDILWGLLLLVNILCFVLFVIGGDHVSIIVNIFFTHLILTLRAGQINHYNTINTSFLETNPTGGF